MASPCSKRSHYILVCCGLLQCAEPEHQLPAPFSVWNQDLFLLPAAGIHDAVSLPQ